MPLSHVRRVLQFDESVRSASSREFLQRPTVPLAARDAGAPHENDWCWVDDERACKGSLARGSRGSLAECPWNHPRGVSARPERLAEGYRVGVTSAHVLIHQCRE